MPDQHTVHTEERTRSNTKWSIELNNRDNYIFLLMNDEFYIEGPLACILPLVPLSEIF